LKYTEQWLREAEFKLIEGNVTLRVTNKLPNDIIIILMGISANHELDNIPGYNKINLFNEKTLIGISVDLYAYSSNETINVSGMISDADDDEYDTMVNHFMSNEISSMIIGYRVEVYVHVREYGDELKKLLKWLIPYINKDQDNRIGFIKYESEDVRNIYLDDEDFWIARSGRRYLCEGCPFDSETVNCGNWSICFRAYRKGHQDIELDKRG
jgi:hypothetical protein